jgi:hypothetical protein
MKIPFLSSDMFMVGKDFQSFLGGVRRDADSGNIVSAEATILFFFSRDRFYKTPFRLKSFIFSLHT